MAKVFNEELSWSSVPRDLSGGLADAMDVPVVKHAVLAPLQHTVHHKFAVGDEVSFARKSGVARGLVRRVVITVNAAGDRRSHRPQSNAEVAYEIEVKHRGREYLNVQSHRETAVEALVHSSLDDAWKAHESFAFPERE